MRKERRMRVRWVCSEEKDEQHCCFIVSSFNYGHELCVVTKESADRNGGNELPLKSVRISDSFPPHRMECCSLPHPPKLSPYFL